MLIEILFLGCIDVSSCKCNVSLGYISEDVQGDSLNTVVDVVEGNYLNLRLQNTGTEPAYGSSLNISSTVPLSIKERPGQDIICTNKGTVSLPSIPITNIGIRSIS